MPHPFEIVAEETVDATPDQVWAAITNGPQIDSWFMGKSEVEPRLGGKTTFEIFGEVSESTITAWEPGRRFAYRSAPDADGKFMAFETTIEGRAGGKTRIRLVHSGFLGDDWEAEYTALQSGDPMYLHKLAQYVTHFAGKVASANLFAPGPQVASREQLWSAVRGALGLRDNVAEGDAVHAQLDGLPSIDGVVDYVRPDHLGLRTDDGLYRFMYAMGTSLVEHHVYAPKPDPRETVPAWQAWLGKVLA